MVERSRSSPGRQPPGRAVRVEATVHPGRQDTSLESLADLDLDQVPDPEGGLRVLLTPEQAIRLAATSPRWKATLRA